MINQKLSIINEELGKINSPALRYLRKGINHDSFSKFIVSYFPKINVPEELSNLYAWHEGVNIIQEMPMGNFLVFSTFYLNKLDEIALIYEKGIFDFKDNNLFPFCSSGQGEFLTINLIDLSASIIDTPIFLNQLYDPSRNPYISIYDNIYSMLDTMIECYKQEVYYNENGLLNVKIDQEWEISQNMNPKSDFWK